MSGGFLSAGGCFAAVPAALLAGRFALLLSAAGTARLAASRSFVDRGPGATFGSFLGDALLLVALLNVADFALLLVG